MSDFSSAPVAVLTALVGAAEATVAAACAASPDVALVRRCADVAELVSTAEAGLGRVVLVSATFHGLDADVVARVERSGSAVVALVDPDRESGERLTAWGVTVEQVPGLATGTGEHTLVVQAVTRAAARSQAFVGGDLPSETRRPSTVGSEVDDELAGLLGPAATEVPQYRGEVTVVWGPAGAPGRTTLAVTLAAELAASGEEVLLVDADTCAASVAQVLGLLDESAGIVAACRAGSDGRLDPPSLRRLAPLVAPRLRVLTGISRSARWSELRPAGLASLVRTARSTARHVVVDVAAPLEDEDDLLLEPSAPRRNGAAVDLLRLADRVVAVGSADPVGLQRLVRGLQELAAVAPAAEVTVVVNRVRASSVGRGAGPRVREALRRFAGVADVHLVPEDRSACDDAVLTGRSLVEAAPDGPACTAVRRLARHLVGAPASRRLSRRALRVARA